MWEIEMRWGSLLKICSLTIGAFVMVVLVQAMISNTAARDGNINWPTIATSQYASGLDLPVHITHANDGSGRMFVVEKPGRIQIIRGGSVETTPFLDITDRVLSAGNEQGLLSVAFPPTYTEKGYFYVDYTDLNGDTVIARYHVTADPDVAEAGSEEIILRIPQPYENHNGGQLAFGPDGYLYIGMGDGGSGGDPHDYAQDPGSLLGKILRIDVELSRTTVSSALPITIYLPLVSKSGGLPYRIPPSNPFTETTGYRD